MRRPEGTVFVHFSKYYPENLLIDLSVLKNWYENQSAWRNIHISFPVFFWNHIKEDEILFFWLSRLIKEKSFTYFPNTYSGENHQILSSEEAELDLAWTIQNPNAIGYQDLFKSEPTGINISNADLYRPKRQMLYHQYKNTILIEGIREESRGKLMLYREGKHKRAIPLYSFGWRGLAGQILDFLSPFPSSHSLLYWSNLEKKALTPFLRDLPKRQFREAPLSKNKRLSAGYFVNLNPLFAESDLIPRAQNFVRQTLRPSLLSKENIANNLTAVMPALNTPSSPLKGDPQQILEGEMSLSSGNLKLSFKRGQFLGWSNTRKNLPTLPLARSYSVAGKFRESDYHSTSLELGELSGIRQVVFAGSDVSSSLDYFPLEKEEGFLINAHFNWTLKSLKSNPVLLAPLELPLYRLEKDSLLKISVLNSDGESYDRLIPDDEVTDVLWGESFFFHHLASPLMLTFPSLEKRIKFPLALKTKKIKGFYTLFLNLGGVYSPISVDSKTSLHQSFSLLISQPSKMPFSPLEPPSSIRNETSTPEIWYEKD